MRRIGVLMGYAESDRQGQANVTAFRMGFQKLGSTEGRNVAIEYRWAAAEADLVQQFAKELVALQPDLILTQNTPITAAVLQQTRTDSHHFRERFRSGRQQLRRGPAASGRQRHRLNRY